MKSNAFYIIGYGLKRIRARIDMFFALIAAILSVVTVNSKNKFIFRAVEAVFVQY